MIHPMKPLLRNVGLAVSALRNPVSAAGKIALAMILLGGCVHADEWTLDSSFQLTLEGTTGVMAHVRQPDGRELIAGWFNHVNNQPVADHYSLLRLLEDGTLDPSFTASLPATGGSISRLFLQPDGRILALGDFPRGDGSEASVRRFTSSGATDSSFTEITDNLSAIAVDSSGRIYAVRDSSSGALVRYSADGQLDASFQAPVIAGTTKFITPLPDGKILLTQQKQSDNYTLVRLRADGTTDPAFAALAVWQLISTVGFPDGSVLVCSKESAGLAGERLLFRRLPPNASSDGIFADNFTYFSPPWDVTAAAVQTAVGSVLLDLLRNASPAATASVWADFSGNHLAMTLECRTDGQLMRADIMYGIGAKLHRYLGAIAPPSVTSQPTSQVTNPGHGVKFSVISSDNVALTYQWQMRQGATWQDMQDDTEWSGSMTSMLAFSGSVVSALNGVQFRCVVTNSAGSATSNPATLTVRSTTADFTGDVRPDILFQNSVTGEIGAWAMNGTTPTAWIPMNTVLTQWRIVATADFTGDGKADILFQNSVTGEIGCWAMNGTIPTAWISMNTVLTQWHIVAAADFTGDGKADILFQNSVTGEIGCWAMNGTTPTAWIPMNTVATAWQIVTAADFSADGKPDILFQNTSTGEIGCWTMNGTTATAWISMNTVLTEWRIVSAADFTGDDRPDILFQNSVTGEIGCWAMNGTTPTAWIPMNTVLTAWQIVNH
jgi:uncharacterized delta-60 repeat protein